MGNKIDMSVLGGDDVQWGDLIKVPSSTSC